MTSQRTSAKAKATTIPTPCVMYEIRAALAAARVKYPKSPQDIFRMYMIVAEEFGELAKAIMHLTYEPDKEDGTLEHVRIEALQTAAMLVEFLANINRMTYLPGKQMPRVFTVNAEPKITDK